MAHRYKRTWDGKAKKAVYDHRAAAEAKLGRELRPGEIVHHKDEDRENLAPDNLVPLPSQSAHMRLHHFRRREAKGVIHLFPLDDFLKL